MAETQTNSSWWQTLPGIITAAAGCISAITALIIALHQAGFFKASDAADQAATTPPAQAQVDTIIEKHPPAAIKASGNMHEAGPGTKPGTLDRLEALSDDALLQELESANVGNSVGKGAMLSWLADDDHTYRRISLAAARLLDNRRVKGRAPDLDVIKYRYLELVGRDGGGQLAPDADINDDKLRQAILAAFNDKNGGSVQGFDDITKTR